MRRYELVFILIAAFTLILYPGFSRADVFEEEEQYVIPETEVRRTVDIFEEIGIEKINYRVYGETVVSDSFLDREIIIDFTHKAGRYLGLDSAGIEIDLMREGTGYRTYYLGGKLEGGELVQLLTHSFSPVDSLSGRAHKANTNLQIIISGTKSLQGTLVQETISSWKPEVFRIFNQVTGGETSEVKWNMNGELQGKIQDSLLYKIEDLLKEKLNLEYASGTLSAKSGAIYGASRFFDPGYTVSDSEDSKEINFFLSLNYDQQNNITLLEMGTSPFSSSI